MPENIPPAEHISQVEKRIKCTPPFLALNGNDAKELVGTDGEGRMVTGREPEAVMRELRG